MNKAAAQIREAVFDLQSRAAGEAGIPVVVSTDDVVTVGDGPEILVHSDEAVDLRRAPLPIIVTHRGNQISVGIVDGIQVASGQMRGTARFGERPEAAGYRMDVENGTIRSVSVGYRRGKGIVRRDGVLVTSLWMPTHVAMVAEPADARAGFFRHADADADAEFIPDIEAEPQPPIPQTPPATPATTTRGAIPMEATTAQAGAPAEMQARGHDSVAMERLRIRTLTDLGKQHKVDEATVRAWIDDEAFTADDAARKVLDILVTRSGQRGFNPAEIGMTKKEAHQYSVFKAVRAILNKNDWSKAGLELEAHQEIQRRLGGNPCNEQTFFVPVEAQSVRRHREVVRDMTTAGASGSQYLVSTDNVSFIDLLRNRSVVMTMGATRLGGLVGNVTIPKLTADPTAYWLASESTAITEGQPTIGQLALSPKHVGAYTEISRLLSLQSSPDAESLVMNTIAASIGLAVDSAALAGDGTGGAPTGITSTSGVGSVTGTTLGFAGLLEFQTDVGNALHAAGNHGYVTTGAVAALLAGRVKFTGTASPLWDGSILNANVCGFPGMSSAQMPSAKMIFGAWDQLVIAEWGSLAIEVNPYANFQAGIVGVRGLYAVDVGVRVPAAFSVAATIT